MQQAARQAQSQLFAAKPVQFFIQGACVWTREWISDERVSGSQFGSLLASLWSGGPAAIRRSSPIFADGSIRSSPNSGSPKTKKIWTGYARPGENIFSRWS